MPDPPAFAPTPYTTGPVPITAAPTPSDPVAVARLRGRLSGGKLAHLQRLLATWGMLSDFCFSDLLLFVPLDREGTRFITLAQARPSTGQTLYRADLVGREVGDDDRPLVGRSFRLGEIIEGELTIAAIRERVRVLCIPVRFEGDVIGVLSRESTPSVGRPPGELERVYVEIFNHFAQMIAAGEYPFVSVDSDSDEAPRVGDGVLLLDRSARVSYASPNAVSALHRVGVHANAEGMRLGEVGFDDELGPHLVRPRPPGHRGGRGHGRRHRARALHPVARTGPGRRCGAAGARHLRAPSP